MQISGRCAHWKIANGADNWVLQALQCTWQLSVTNSIKIGKKPCLRTLPITQIMHRQLIGSKKNTNKFESDYQLFLLLVGWNFRYCDHYWPIVPAQDDRWLWRWLWLWRNWWNEDWQGKLKYSEKIWPSATMSTINPTRLGPVLNPGRRGGKPATNRLSYGAALISHNLYTYIHLRLSQRWLWTSSTPSSGKEATGFSSKVA
jgi:hypothetical protein